VEWARAVADDESLSPHAHIHTAHPSHANHCNPPHSSRNQPLTTNHNPVQVGAHFVKDVFANYVFDPLKDAAGDWGGFGVWGLGWMMGWIGGVE